MTRLTRANSFFGIHYDFHANEKDANIGARTSRQMVTRIIDAVRPDYIQIDCKGHRGLCSYPTRVGYPAPGIVRDALRTWRAVTAERGVALFMHYSGVWDTEALKHHPSWARIDASGKRDKDKTSVFGPYADKLLIPQLQELRDRYNVDGAWVDGDCWATVPDYHPDVLATFRKATGIRNIPRKRTDPHFLTFINFCREGFRRYLRHYIDTLRRHDPNFQVASNWAFSSFMPEPVSANLPFLSGDFSSHDSINTARFDARWLAQQGRPWDLMAWSFSGDMNKGDWSTKSIPQLQREAAVVIALGGGFQAYFSQRRDGSVREWQLPLMAAVAKFCRARQPWCQGAKPIPQIALLYSSHAYYREQTGVFSWPDKLTDGLRGTLQALLESQHVVDVVGEHHLKKRMSDYPLIIIPDWATLAPSFRRELRTYVRAGGKLLLAGPRAAALFAKDLGIRPRGKIEEKCLWLSHNSNTAALIARTQSVSLKPGTRSVGGLHTENDPESPATPAGSIRKLGLGLIAGLYVDPGPRYRTAATPSLRMFLSAIVHQLFPNPLVEVRGSPCVDVTATRVNGQLAIHLVNTAGPHADRTVCIHDAIPPVGPLAITLHLPRKPKNIRLEPAGKNLRVTWRNRTATVTLPRLLIHDILVVD